MKRVVLLTGGTGKFGRVLTAHLIQKNWQVIVTSREQSHIDNLRKDLGADADSLFGLVADLRRVDSLDNLVAILSGQGIVVSHLINNARSISTLEVSSTGVTSRENFIGEFDMNVVVPYELTMTLAKSPLHRLKTVVNIGSMYGEVAPNPALYGGTLARSPVQYGVSKAALHHLTRELAVRLAPQDVRVNCIAYGGVEGRVDDDFMVRYGQLTPSRRMLREDEIIGPTEFLLDDASSSINGHVLIADGGWSIW